MLAVRYTYEKKKHKTNWVGGEDEERKKKNYCENSLEAITNKIMFRQKVPARATSTRGKQSIRLDLYPCNMLRVDPRLHLDLETGIIFVLIFYNV